MLVDATAGGLVFPGQTLSPVRKTPGSYDYPESAGVKQLRDLYGETEHGYSQEQSSNSILVTSGVKESILLLALLRRETGSRVWLPQLCWPGYQSIFQFLHYDILYYRHDNIPEDLQVARKHDLIVVNNPHNPTGYCLDENSRQALLEYTQSNGNMLIVDECLQHCTFAPSTRFSRALENFPNVVIVDSLAKWCCMPGVRIGFIIASSKWITLCSTLKNKLLNPTSHIAQLEAMYNLENAKQWLQRTKTSLLPVMESAKRCLKNYGIQVHGETLMYLWIESDHPSAIVNSEIRLGSKAFKIVPGPNFGAPKNFARFSYVDTAANTIVIPFKGVRVSKYG
ncbi:MAG: pyridoxal phosphate-dependent aminotransferase [Sedimenticola sp.]